MLTAFGFNLRRWTMLSARFRPKYPEARLDAPAKARKQRPSVKPTRTAPVVQLAP